MSEPAVHDILNELLVEEQRCLAVRLVESTVFVNQAAMDELGNVQRMARASRKHGAWLADLILSLGGVPGLRGIKASSADLHYQDLRHVLPRLVEDCESLVRLYTRALQHVDDEPLAVELVTRIRSRHQEALDSLKQLA